MNDQSFGWMVTGFFKRESRAVFNLGIQTSTQTVCEEHKNTKTYDNLLQPKIHRWHFAKTSHFGSNVPKRDKTDSNYGHIYIFRYNICL